MKRPVACPVCGRTLIGKDRECQQGHGSFVAQLSLQQYLAQDIPKPSLPDREA